MRPSRMLSAALALTAFSCLAEGEIEAPPPAPAPEPATTPLPAAADPSPVGYPFEAEVSADRVRVRAGGNINDRELKILSKGDRITVLEEQFGWYRIPCPEGCKGWVNARFVSGAPAEGPVQADVTLTGDNVQLRATDNPKATGMGVFPKGTTFHAVRRHGDWVEVLCPKEASAWINAKYVTPLNGTLRPPLTPPKPEEPKEPRNPAPKGPRTPSPAEPATAETREWSRLEASRAAMMRMPLDRQDLESAIAGYQALADACPSGAIKDRCKARIQELSERIRIREEIRNGIGQAREQLQKQFDEINRKYEMERERIEEEYWKVRASAQFTQTGWMGGVGRMIRSPANFRLNKGGRHLCFLVSDTDGNGKEIVDLRSFFNQYVGVIGEKHHDPDWGDVITVKKVLVLEEPEGSENPSAP